MTSLHPCPGCSRHVRAERVCPFCAIALPARALTVAPPSPRPRMSRTAQFAGAATLASLAACSSSTKTPDAGTDTMMTTADGAGNTQDSASDAKDAQPTDAPRDFGGFIPIYSAVFPPSKTRVASSTPAPAHHGRSVRRPGR